MKSITHIIAIFILLDLTSSTLLVSETKDPSSTPIKASNSEMEQRSTTTRCEYYNSTMCPGPGCNGTQECVSDKLTFCYVLWQNTTNVGHSVKLKGCWLGSQNDCHNTHRCIETKKQPKNQLYFCCCSGDLCNREMYHVPATELLLESPTSPVPEILEENLSWLRYTFALAPVFTISILFLFVYWFYKYKKMANDVPDGNDLPISESQTPFLSYKPIQLIEVKAQGRFGSVWKARSGIGLDGVEQFVAVKIFPPQDKSSWVTEHEIYRLPQMRHENILTFLGAEKRGDVGLPFNTEYWLITEYQELGSLSDYLKANTVSYFELLKISIGIARGLTHLHEEIPGNKIDLLKPAVAHRDFKSKNVLLKTDLTACIADFGLALVFHPHQPSNDTLGQVGTRRYMAPEVLEGNFIFQRLDI